MEIGAEIEGDRAVSEQIATTGDTPMAGIERKTLVLRPKVQKGGQEE